MLTALNKRMNPSATTANFGKDIYLSQVQTDEHSVFLTVYTVIGRSTSDASALINDAPTFQFIGEISTDTPASLYGESTTGSEYGESLDLRKRIQMQDWLHDINGIKPIPDTPSGIDSSKSRRSTAVRPVSTNPSALSDEAPVRQVNATAMDMLGEPSEDDDDLDFQVVRNLFRKTGNSLAAQDHQSAKALFQQGLEIADNLSVRGRVPLDPGRIRMRYADCRCLPTSNGRTAHGPQDARRYPRGGVQPVHCQTATTGSLRSRKVLSKNFERPTESALD